MKIKRIFVLLSVCAVMLSNLKAANAEEITAEPQESIEVPSTDSVVPEGLEDLTPEELAEFLNEAPVEEPAPQETETEPSVIEAPADDKTIEQKDVEEDTGYRWVSFIGRAGQDSVIPADAKIDIVLKSADVFDEIVLTVGATNGYKTQAELPIGTYKLSFSPVSKEENSGLFVNDPNGGVVVIEEDGQQFDFEIISESKMQVSEGEIEEEPVVVEEEENFWLTLLKNNIIFLILLLGCGIALFVVRWRKDNM